MWLEEAKANAFDKFRALWKQRGTGVRAGDVYEAVDDLVEEYEAFEKEELEVMRKAAEPFLEILKRDAPAKEKCHFVKDFFRATGPKMREIVTRLPEWKAFLDANADLVISKEFHEESRQREKKRRVRS